MDRLVLRRFSCLAVVDCEQTDRMSFCGCAAAVEGIPAIFEISQSLPTRRTRRIYSHIIRPFLRWKAFSQRVDPPPPLIVVGFFDLVRFFLSKCVGPINHQTKNVSTHSFHSFISFSVNQAIQSSNQRVLT